MLKFFFNSIIFNRCIHLPIFYSTYDSIKTIFQAFKAFKEDRNFHDPNDREIDSDFSEGDEHFDYPKQVEKEGKTNLSIAVFHRFRERDLETGNMHGRKKRISSEKNPLKHRSGFKRIWMQVKE